MAAELLADALTNRPRLHEAFSCLPGSLRSSSCFIRQCLDRSSITLGQNQTLEGWSPDSPWQSGRRSIKLAANRTPSTLSSRSTPHAPLLSACLPRGVRDICPSGSTSDEGRLCRARHHSEDRHGTTRRLWQGVPQDAP